MVTTDLTKYLGIEIDVEAYRKRMKGVYDKFARSRQTPDGCEAIANKGPHKQRKLLAWLQEKYDKQFPAKDEREEPYIKRPHVEEQCYDAIAQPGSLIRIKAPKRMGKTLLIDNLLSYAENNLGYSIARWDGLQVEKAAFQDLGKFWRLLCNYIGRQLNLVNRVDDFWDDELGQNNSCTLYFEEYLLEHLENPLVLGLDNFDLIFPYTPVAEAVSALLRFWHEQAKRSEIWKKLRLVVAHSTDIYAYPQLDINRSPFNVGFAIELPEFTLEEIQELATQYNLEVRNPEILQKTIGGHPFLVHEAFQYCHFHSDRSLEQLMELAITDRGLYHNHLRELLNFIEQDEKLIKAIKIIVESNNPVRVSQDEAFKLYSLGVVLWCKEGIKPRCQLYRAYFRQSLGL
ncbi:MAG: AAA-like domain-containing protein [Cyanobacteria bacterium P01_E01_bin.42]